MSSITGGLGQISDLQTQIWQMYNKINNATINEGQKHVVETVDNDLLREDFVKTLEEQMQKQNQPNLETNLLQNEQLGMPAGLNITQAGSVNESYDSIISSLMESLSQQNDNLKIKTTNTETTGSLAFKHNSASNFIQKLIDSYKDKGSVNGINI